jgi:dTDP-4-dehydrorhamnose 3,5-epimerase-like enzyme
MAVKSTDERGSVHHFTTQRSGQYMVFYRHQGAIGARHYHKGLSANKNPEQFVLLSGKAKLNWKDLRSNEEGSVMLESPVEVDIYPWIWHEVVAETDFVMLELNAMQEGPLDTFYMEKD